MPTYFVVELEITNQAAMEPYRAAVGATIDQYGGRFLARAGANELIEGGPQPKRIVILEFPDKADAQPYKTGSRSSDSERQVYWMLRNNDATDRLRP
jgi:uncharacterized protein (DUF1330 family)